MQGDQREDRCKAQGTPGDKGGHIARSQGDTEGRRRVTDTNKNPAVPCAALF
jgi:hypothetical protein